MAEITAALVKELREMTGAGMMECKKALVEAEGNIDAAVDVLRTRGLAAAAKKAGRATNEGVVAAFVCDGCGVGALAEVNCETDFVSGNEKFVAFTKNIAEAVALGNPADLEEFKTMACGEDTADAALAEAIHIFGENMQISRIIRIAPAGTGAVVSYTHMGGKIGVLVEFAFNNADTATNEAFLLAGKDIAMQVAAANPVSVSRDDVDPAIVEHEMGIYKAQAAESGKPEAIQEKMATGRLEKYFKENCLIEQDFVKDPDKTVKQYLAEVSKAIGDEITVKSFVRFLLGESIDA
ncbi:MAG: elongation factor Ts [Actinobacteria bacterium]|nr:elongation factor Ts [Actinomycetota bacterium]